MAKLNLGEKLYEKIYPMTLDGENDKNGHLNHSWYDNNSETIRQEFLRRFG